jgi:hypothetical protein
MSLEFSVTNSARGIVSSEACRKMLTSLNTPTSFKIGQSYIFGLASAIPTLKSLDTLTLLLSRRSPNFNRISPRATAT